MSSIKLFFLLILSIICVSCVSEQSIKDSDEPPLLELTLSEQESEFMLGNLESSIMLQGNTLLLAPELEGNIQKVLSRLSDATDFTSRTRVFIVNSPLVNAWACPNGDVLITTGMLTIVENIDELAVILGHELAHLKHHDGYAKTLDALSRRKTMHRVSPLVITAAATAGASAAGVFLGTVHISDDVTHSLYNKIGVLILSDLTGRLIMHAGTTVSEGILASQVSRYSQTREVAADLTAVKYVELAQYNAKRGSKIFSKLRDLEKNAISNK